MSYTKRLAIVAATYTLSTAAAGPVTPDSGAILQQTPPTPPAYSPFVEPPLKIEQERNPSLPSGPGFFVKTLRLEGHSLFSSEVLHTLIADAEGQKLSLSGLNEITQRISDYYQQHGYPLTRAFIPEQTVRDGSVLIEILEARFGMITLQNHSGMDGKLLGETIAPLKDGALISQALLDQAILLLSDIPGIAPTATLKPGQVRGTADLVIEINAAESNGAIMTFDSEGNRYTGRTRMGMWKSFLNPLRAGDVLSIGGVSSGRGMNFARLGYDSLLNGSGTHAGVLYSTLDYKLGDSLTSLQGKGSAETKSAWIRQPFLRSPDANLSAQMQYEHKFLRDDLAASGVRTTRQVDNWTGSISGDMRNVLLTESVTSVTLSWLEGSLHFGSPAARSMDASSAKAAGRFSKWNVYLSHVQSMGSDISLVLNLTHQLSSKNLDSSEKLVAGGPGTVRAYDIGTLSGDEGTLVSAELRKNLSIPWEGQSQAIVFVDREQIRVNKNPWGTGSNIATLSGAGAGINWVGTDQSSFRVSLASPLGSTPSIAGTRESWRLWLSAGRPF